MEIKIKQYYYSDPLGIISAAVVAYVISLCLWPSYGNSNLYTKSAVGDAGMQRDGLRVAFEGWNFCNEVGEEAPQMGSPRAADCFDLSSTAVELQHKVSVQDNKLGVGTSFPGLSPYALYNPDLYAAEKELYLGSLCQVNEDTTSPGSADHSTPWHFWMVMLKNGNLDTTAGLCPDNGRKVGSFPEGDRFPCFGPGCMNQPVLYHDRTKLVLGNNGTMMMMGGFYGTYDLGAAETVISGRKLDGMAGVSYYEVMWEKKVGQGNSSWVFNHKLKTSDKYPWLMLYLRADATSGFSGGYHYDTRGMLKILPESPNFKVRFNLEVKQGGGPLSQFYLMDMGSCWKNNGKPCDGDVLTDVTRYSEMIINPETIAVCSKYNLTACPPYHIYPNNTVVSKNDVAHFPYDAYHYYCGPGNAKYLDNSDVCDPYSNPQAQEILQLLPHPVWAEYGYPTSPGQGWIGDPRTWELDVGGLSSRLYFYQDPGTAPAKRVWSSLDIGTEIYVSDKEEVAEWTVSHFDVIIPS